MLHDRRPAHKERLVARWGVLVRSLARLWPTEGESCRLVPGEHAVVAHGADATGIDIMDGGTGGYYHSSWTAFLRRWGYFHEMALRITSG